MVDYLMKILNESYSGNNIDTDEDPQFRECDVDLSDENLEQCSHHSDSEVYASDEEINKNFYMEKDKNHKIEKKKKKS